MFPNRAFITFTNEKYMPLISKLIESVLMFSKYPIIVYTYNFSHDFNHKQVYTKRIDDDVLGIPEYIKDANDITDNIGIVTRNNFNSYYTLSRKPTILTDAMDNGLVEGIFLDGDGIITESVDSMFEYLTECENYPLVGKGLFDYMIINGKGGPADPLELPLMNLLNVNKRSMHYVQSNFMVFNKQCRSFFDECVIVSNHPEVLKNFYNYAPFQDETIINVLLWKYNANKQLPIVHFNLSNYEELLNFHENKKCNYYVKDCPWHYIPENKNDIKFFHGCKSESELTKCLHYFKKKTHTMKTLTNCNKNRIAIVTLFDKNYEDLAKYSLPNKLAYANKHGYDFYYYDHILDLNRPPHWSKILAIQNVLNTNKYDWVWWIDIDSLIMNFDIKLESIIDNSYDIIFTHNLHSYISNGSSFFKNSDISKQFLNDSYLLEKEYLKNIDVNIFDHEQQSMRLLVLNETIYKEKTKLINERVCNSYCVTKNESVLSSYPNWNIESNIYKDGDFVIQFCGRTFQERMIDFLNYMLPEKIALVLFARDEFTLQKQIESVKNSRFKFELYIPSKHNPRGYSSYSQLVNDSVCNTKSEYMVFVNPKTVLNDSDLEFMIKELLSGKCFASIVGFGLFAATKSLFKEVGMMDERFLGGEYEDNDFAIRLKIKNKAIFAKLDLSKYSFQSQSSEYNPIRGCSLSLFLDKWNPRYDIPGNYTEYVITEKNLQNKRLPTFVKVDENIKYSWLDFESSYICDRYYIFNHLKNINIKTVPHDKIKIESDVVLICKFDNTNKLFVEFLSNNNHFITVHVNDITQPNNHHNRHVSTLNSNNWWAMDFDDNLYEIRIFHQGILLYSTILVKGIENISKFRLYTNVFK